MKKFCVFLLIIILCSSFNFAQSKKAISILGDSYSTFEGYLQPDTNSIWYYTLPRHKTDVVSVRQTWWHQLIRENDYRLCVNNSFSGATICNTGYRKADYSDRSFLFLVQRMTVGQVLRLVNINMKDGQRRTCISFVLLWLICSTI